MEQYTSQRVGELIPGAKLPNGRYVVSYIILPNGDGFVLAQNKRENPTEWASWKFYRGDLGSTSHGHHFRSETKAYGDLQERFCSIEFYENQD